MAGARKARHPLSLFRRSALSKYSSLIGMGVLRRYPVGPFNAGPLPTVIGFSSYGLVYHNLFVYHDVTRTLPQMLPPLFDVTSVFCINNLDV